MVILYSETDIVDHKMDTIKCTKLLEASTKVKLKKNKIKSNSNQPLSSSLELTKKGFNDKELRRSNYGSSYFKTKL